MKERWDLSVPLGRVVVASLRPASPCKPENVGLCPRPGLLSQSVVLGQAVGSHRGAGGPRGRGTRGFAELLSTPWPLTPASSEEGFGWSRNPRCSRLLMMLFLRN